MTIKKFSLRIKFLLKKNSQKNRPINQQDRFLIKKNSKKIFIAPKADSWPRIKAKRKENFSENFKNERNFEPKATN